MSCRCRCRCRIHMRAASGCHSVTAASGSMCKGAVRMRMCKGAVRMRVLHDMRCRQQARSRLGQRSRTVRVPFEPLAAGLTRIVSVQHRVR